MSDNSEYKVRNAKPSEFEEIGKLLVEVYAQLEGFPKPSEQPEYYEKLANIGDFINKPGAELLVALSPEDKILGAVVFFSDIKYYGSGGSATREKKCGRVPFAWRQSTSQGKGYRKTPDRLLHGQGKGKSCRAVDHSYHYGHADCLENV